MSLKLFTIETEINLHKISWEFIGRETDSAIYTKEDGTIYL